MSRGVFLRRAGPADTAAVAELERVSSLHPWSEALVQAELERSAPDAVLVLEARSGIVAYCAFRIVLDEMHVMNLAVHPERPKARPRTLPARERARARRARGSDAGAARGPGRQRRPRGRSTRNPASSRSRERKGYYSDPPEDALVLVRERRERDRS